MGQTARDKEIDNFSSVVRVIQKDKKLSKKITFYLSSQRAPGLHKVIFLDKKLSKNITFYIKKICFI